MDEILGEYKRILGYRDQVVDASIDALVASGMTGTEANQYRLLLQKVYELAYDAGRKDGVG